MRSRIDVRPSTIARDDSYLRNHVLPAFGDRQLDSIDQADVREWVGELHRTKRLAPATVQKAYQLMTGLMSAAVDAKLLRSSPCYNVPLPRIEREEMRFLTPMEVWRLADTITSRYRALVLVGCYGGLRIGELAGLERQHVEHGRSRLRVVQGLVEVHGQISIGPLKTRASRRTVSLPGPVFEALAEHLRDYTEGDPTSPVFAGRDGGRLRSRAFRQREWLRATEAAGLAPLRIHDMRHTAVALWIAAGGSPLQVSKRAGHSSVSFTLDRYGHLYEDADDMLMTGLSEIMGNARPRASGDGLASVTPIR
jgi:integrase